MSDINSLAEQLKTYLTKEQIDHVCRAYYYAEQAHDGQKRRSGEYYITHPLAVANILSKMHMDYQGLMAAMLHDVIEDSEIKKDAIAKQFGDTVADIVDGVSKLTHISFESRATAQGENFQKMSLALSKDIRVILVKLADRMHNMRTLGAMPPYKRRTKAKETLEIYSPIAHRLGMHDMCVEFEELGFAAMCPLRFRLLNKAVSKVRGKREKIVNEVIDNIRIALKKHQISAKITGREKHLYSIYQKMKLKKKSFSEIMDVFGVRIVTESIDDCYRILGLIHNLHKPIPGRFKDYIAIPKANGYQSLHTTLFGAHAIPVEVQVRTYVMDDMANDGIAAHWFYKEKEAALAVSQNHSKVWIQNLLELRKTSTNPAEFIESVKTDLFPNAIYVFTPKGDILELPTGASAIDFAYAVHSQIGNTCVACRVNRRLTSLSQPLESGQTIEIITANNAQPRTTWLNFAVSSKARANIKHFLKQQNRQESIDLGKRLLNTVLSQVNPPINDFDDLPDKILSTLLKKLNIASKNELLEDVGSGKRLNYITGYLTKLLSEEQTLTSELSSGSDDQLLLVTGQEGSVISFANCCHPIPGDPIIGYLQMGKGITIHRQSCLKLCVYKNQHEVLADVGWDDHIKGIFEVNLSLQILTNKTVFSSIVFAITSIDGEIIRFLIEDSDSHIHKASIIICIKDRIHLARIIRRLRHIPDILSIHRQ